MGRSCRRFLTSCGDENIGNAGRLIAVYTICKGSEVRHGKTRDRAVELVEEVRFSKQEVLEQIPNGSSSLRNGILYGLEILRRFLPQFTLMQTTTMNDLGNI